MEPPKEAHSEEHTGNWYVLIHGLSFPNEPLILAPGISLIPLPGPLTVFDLAAAGAAGFGAWNLIAQIGHGCSAEIESAKDSDLTPGYDTLNRAWLASSLLILRGFGNAMPVACSAYPWSTIAEMRKQQADWYVNALLKSGMTAQSPDDGKLRPFRGHLLDFHTHMISLPSFRQDGPGGEDAAWCRSNFASFNSLCAESESFRFALEAAIEWRYSKDVRSAIARLWAGIESLFGVNNELVFRISAYGAALLHPRGEARASAFIRYKLLYGLRSKAVHGEKVGADKLLECVDGSYELLRSLLMYTVQLGRVPTDSDIHSALFT